MVSIMTCPPPFLSTDVPPLLRTHVPESETCIADEPSKHVITEYLIGHLFSTHRLRQPSSEQFYITRHRPPSSIRLLRIEENRLQKEADTLCALSGENELNIPRLVEYHHKTSHRRGPHIISGPFKGPLLGEIALRLSNAEAASIDRSRGQYLRSLSRVKGPKAFGPIRSGATASSGRSSWSRYFAKLVNSILEDGEDALVTLPADMIRMLIQRHHVSLDMITQPRLTLLELASEDNLVVDISKMRVTGVLDFSTAVWGDPLLADCFMRPSNHFLEGYGDAPGSDVHARIRQYLYITFHSLLAIVRHRFRPSEDDDELEARRTLTTALHQLASLSPSVSPS